ncbi:SAM-dependent methyltransferase [Amycolatopsis cihanbeyliensis]|uniref:S-adenosyl methyltransferase n=1 Tax=Amycolatopsis cihanbeyliensis TaxID=1128664 RepID=A0A542DR51_AMYCI|nr:SAM-dependent methyltransferase [Amycolatopsis cihanbeyliensis]TQJ05569.1 S-adenosyl methyltransferase [Amycolatopsis cihanbeyliensis]
MTDLAGGTGPELARAGRIRDYLLGDGHNLAVDRRLAAALETAVPDIRQVIRLNRGFLHRAMRSLLAADIGQFLDLGSSVLAAGNVREVVRRSGHGCRIVHVDADPITVRQGRSLLNGAKDAVVVQADPADAGRVFDHPDTARMLDPGRPIGVIMVDLLHFVPDAMGPAAVVAEYRRRIAPGSRVVLSHFTGDHWPTHLTRSTVEVMSRSGDPIRPRSYEEVVAMLAGFELVEPGVVGVGEWHPERRLDPVEERAAAGLYAAVARVP